MSVEFDPINGGYDAAGIRVAGDRQPQSLFPRAGASRTALALRAAGTNGIRGGLLYREALAAAGAALARAVSAGAWRLGGGIHRVSPLIESVMPV